MKIEIYSHPAGETTSSECESGNILSWITSVSKIITWLSNYWYVRDKEDTLCTQKPASTII